MRMLGSEDIANLMEQGYTLMDIKAMSDLEIATVLRAVDHDESEVRQTEQDYSIWGLTPAQYSV